MLLQTRWRRRKILSGRLRFDQWPTVLPVLRNIFAALAAVNARTGKTLIGADGIKKTMM
jgi:hypothetical protein